MRGGERVYDWDGDACGKGTGIGRLMRGKVADEGSGKLGGMYWFKVDHPHF